MLQCVQKRRLSPEPPDAFATPELAAVSGTNALRGANTFPKGRARHRDLLLLVGTLATFALGGCSLSDAPAPPEGSFAFGVFGDGPYSAFENGRFRRLIVDVNKSDLAFFLHVGDILGGSCSDEEFLRARTALDGVRTPVIYTPGDNEWTDCHSSGAGEHRPLDRLASLRRIFFHTPGRTLGATHMKVETQGSSSTFADIVENVRFLRGGFLFSTLHIVGSANGLEPFAGRSISDDSAAARRTAAALAWMREGFEIARRDSLAGVVLIMHGDPGLSDPLGVRAGYEELLSVIRGETMNFRGSVLLIHGDSHTYIVDNPLKNPTTGQVLANFTRLETFGSPEIGWVRVVVDSINGVVTSFEPRLMRHWWWF